MIRNRRHIVRVIGILAMVAWMAVAAAGETDASRVVLTPEELQADLDFVVRTMKQVHPDLFARLSEDEFEERRARLESRLNRSMTALSFYRIIAPFVASIGDAHTHIMPAPDTLLGDPNFLPVRVRLVGNRAYVREDLSGAGLPTGGQLVTVDDVEVEEFIDQASNYFGREHEDKPPIMVEGRFSYLYWLLHGASETYEVVVETPSQGRQIFGVPGQPVAAFHQAMASQEPGGLGAERQAFAYSYVQEFDVGLLEVRSFLPRHQGAFIRFLQAAFRHIAENDVRWLIIDVRNNNGGSPGVSDRLLAYLTDRPVRNFMHIDHRVSRQAAQQKGQPFIEERLGGIDRVRIPEARLPRPQHSYNRPVLVLVDQSTFSTAAIFAGVIKQYRLGVLIGEETGGLVSSFGDPLNFPLPNSELMLGVSRAYFEGVGGADRQRGILPDHEVPPTPQDLEAGRDTALLHALSITSPGVPRDELSEVSFTALESVFPYGEAPYEGDILYTMHKGEAPLFIAPTGENGSELTQQVRRAIMELRRRLDAEGEVITDTEALERDLSEHTLFVFGTLSGNAWLAEHLDELPFEVSDDAITLGPHTAGAGMNVVTAWPNPANPNYGMVIFTATEMERVFNIAFRDDMPRDYAVFDGSGIISEGRYQKTNGQWSLEQTNSR